MAQGALGPQLWWQIRDDNDLPVNGGRLYTYLSGTTTPASIYTDANLAVAYAFPAVSDSLGRIGYYMDPALGNLKFQQTDADDVPIGFNGGFVDPVGPTNAGVGIGAIIYDFNANSAASIVNTSYTSGAGFDKCQPGSSPWMVDPASLSGTYVLELTGVMVTSGTLTLALVNLTDGAPDTPIATATLSSLTGATAQSAAITFPVSGATRNFGIKPKVSANSGFVIGARIVKTA